MLLLQFGDISIQKMLVQKCLNSYIFITELLCISILAFTKERGTWMANFYYTNWQGERKRKNKRGFPTKKEALAYERQFLQQTGGDMEMEVASYAELYLDDVKLTVKESTWEGKVHYVNSKMIPYFGKMKIIRLLDRALIP